MIKRGFLKDFSFSNKIIVLFGLIVVFMSIAVLVGLYFIFPLFNVTPTQNPTIESFKDLNLVSAFKWFQITSAFCMFLLPALIFSLFVDSKLFGNILFGGGKFTLLLLLSMTAMIIALPIINWFDLLNHQLPLPIWMIEKEAEAKTITDAFLKMNNIGDLILNIFMVAMLAAVGEEMLFRGTIQPLLGEIIKNKHVVIWVTAALFSAFHMQFAGFIPRMFIGALLGYLLDWTGSLWVPIVVHFTNNMFAVVVSYFIGKGIINPEFETIGVNSDQEKMLVLVSIALFIPLVYSIYKLTKTKTISTTIE